MKINKKWKILLIPLFLVSVVIMVFTFLYLNRDPLPTEIIEESRRVISQAVKKDAGLYAACELARAEAYREQLLEEWRNQNKKPVYNRKYNRVEELAGLSIAEAKKAMLAAEKNRKQLEQQIDEKMKTASGNLHEFESRYYQLPLPGEIRKKYIRAKLLFTEGESALRRNDKLQAVKKINTSLEIIAQANSDAGKFISEYFSMYSSWQKWVRETIQWSAGMKEYAIVVDKLAHTCTLYKDGKVIKVFGIEMGPNWIGDKVQQGDRATPEGKYHITKKLVKPQTIYHKALLINYPNEDDKKRFSLDKKNGNLPSRAQIGSLIEIHGEGGKGIHWTDGCVALINKDMDILYQFVKVGTPVTIVGSTKPLSQIFE